ncbi:hypothetical protein ECZU15_01930 [Escherichia coli]|nr:hypothetical protein FJMB80155_42980 [Escherichia coli]GHK78609.1 hypothetical protein ECZU13_44740 [Escherichia coli]GHK79261.1 hypothetical protein ECZU15_01930 [Escherichia coli]
MRTEFVYGRGVSPTQKIMSIFVEPEETEQAVQMRQLPFSESLVSWIYGTVHIDTPE